MLRSSAAVASRVLRMIEVSSSRPAYNLLNNRLITTTTTVFNNIHGIPSKKTTQFVNADHHQIRGYSRTNNKKEDSEEFEFVEDSDSDDSDMDYTISDDFDSSEGDGSDDNEDED